MSVSGEWQGLTIIVQLTDEHKPITGRLVEHNARGVVLAVRMHKHHSEGTSKESQYSVKLQCSFRGPASSS